MPGQLVGKTNIEAGADDFIKKPFNIEKVIDRMLELVGA